MIHPSHPGVEFVSAFAHLPCPVERRADAVARLCRDPRVVSLDEGSGRQALVLTVMAPDLQALSTLVLDDIPAMTGSAPSRTYVISEAHTDGSDWRLDALDASQRARAAAACPPKSAHRGGRPLPPDESWALTEALARNPRLPLADLARVVDRNPATVRRHLERLLASDALSLRCDMAHRATGWPIACVWFARTSSAEHARTIAELKSLPQLRLCVSLLGEANLAFTVFSRTVRGLARFEQMLGQRLPALQLLESTLLLREIKRMGWLLNGDGRCTGEVIVPSVLSPRSQERAVQPGHGL